MKKAKKIFIIAAIWLILVLTDFTFAQLTHHPIFSLPLVGAGNGSQYYYGILYRLDEHFVGTMGDGSPPEYSYSIRPWFWPY